MTSNDHDTHPALPRHFYVGVGCGVLSLITALFAIAYYVCVGLGYFTEPPRGLTPIWTTVIALLAMVPIGMVCAHLAAKPLHRRLDRIEACLERASEEALRAANESGYWRGRASLVKQDVENLADPAEVIRLVRDSRRNGNVG